MSPLDPQILDRIASQSNSSSKSRKIPISTERFQLSDIQLTLSGMQKKSLVAVAVVAVAISVLLLLSAQARPSADVIPVATESASRENEVTAELVVDVQGEVLEPGLYELPLGSRVGDAIKAAGGVRKGVSSASVNLARFLEDGEQLYVSAQGEDFPGGSSSGVGGKLNLNRATESELDGLPGVGPVLAKRIIEYRSTRGNFTDIDELRKVSGIGPAKFAELQSFVTV